MAVRVWARPLGPKSSRSAPFICDSSISIMLSRGLKHHTVPLLLALLLTTSPRSAAVNLEQQVFLDLEAWVEQHGGQVRTYVGTNSAGIRGLFAKEAIKAEEAMVTLTSKVVINTGSQTGGFMTPPLMVLRELLHKHSRFEPYLRIIPPRDEVLSACNIDTALLPLLESKYWTHFVNSWQDYMKEALAGTNNQELEYTVPEVLGSANVTVEDLQYACALAGTRYIAPGKRTRLLMIPIFDMANHKRGCPHKLTADEKSGVLRFVAKTDLQAGDEICFDYGEMHDDYALLSYGFLPDLEDPPRLLLIDHHNFNASLTHQEADTEVVFTSDDPYAIQDELQRLESIHSFLVEQDKQAAQDKSRPAPGSGYVSDALLELQKRRRLAIKHEIARVSKLLASNLASTTDKTEL